MSRYDARNGGIASPGPARPRKSASVSGGMRQRRVVIAMARLMESCRRHNRPTKPTGLFDFTIPAQMILALLRASSQPKFSGSVRSC